MEGTYAFLKREDNRKLRIFLGNPLIHRRRVRARAAAREGLLSEDVAEAVVFMLTWPPNVTIRDLVMLPQNQDL